MDKCQLIVDRTNEKLCGNISQRKVVSERMKTEIVVCEMHFKTLYASTNFLNNHDYGVKSI